MPFFPQHIGFYDYIYMPYTEITQILKKEMAWKDGEVLVEHLDCELHDVPFYMNTLKIPNISRNTFRNSGLIRQGILTREEALKQEEKDLTENTLPKKLEQFLMKNKITYDEYVGYVKNSDKSVFEPKWQKTARKIYHRFRKY